MWYTIAMNRSISHNRNEETLDAKAAWFQTLTIEERMEMLCEFTEMLLTVNPNITDKKDAEQIKKGICILSAT